MKIKANTLKRAKRLQRALARGDIGHHELMAKAWRLETGPYAPDSRRVHAAILREVSLGTGPVSVQVSHPAAQIALWRARGFRVHEHGWFEGTIVIEGWAGQ